jgi:hypothetical protein
MLNRSPCLTAFQNPELYKAHAMRPFTFNLQFPAESFNLINTPAFFLHQQQSLAYDWKCVVRKAKLFRSDWTSLAVRTEAVFLSER